MIKAGISTACVFPLKTEDALVRLSVKGIDNFEIFINSDSELTEEFGEKLKKILEYYSKQVISLHPYTSEMEGSYFFSNYLRRWEDGIAYYRKYFKIAQYLNAQYVILHGPKNTTEISDVLLAERLLRLNEIAIQYETNILLENVERCYSRSPEVFYYLREKVPQVGYTLDTKQVIRAGYNINEFVKSMDKNLKHIHLSDHGKKGNCLPIGDGEFNLKEFFDLLKQLGINATAVLELYGMEGKEDILKQSYDNIQGYL